jgi:hypothetical protein
MNQKTSKKGRMLLLLGAVTFFFVSCIDGYDEDKLWSSGVANAQLESPAAESITVTKGIGSMTISWPVVYGAGGYQFSLYIVDDPDNPVIVGEENEVVDGCSVQRELLEDTKYKIVVKTLGNPKYNNKEAVSATEKNWENMLPVYKIIPDGTNLTDYFAAEPIPESETELCYELEAGGNYTMNGDVPVGTSVTIRGNKLSHAKLTMTNGSFVNNGVGFILKFIDIDYAAFDGSSSSAIILMDATPNPSISLTEGGYTLIPSTLPIAIQSCKITGLKYYLFYDNNKKYAIGTFLIKDCIIGLNTNSFGNATIRFQSGMVKDMTWTTTTFYNEVAAHSSNRIIQISAGNVTSVKPATEIWANGVLTVSNCTFWQMAKGAQSFNSNGAFGLANDKVSITDCIVVDSGEHASTASANGFVRRFRRGNTTAQFSSGRNSYWYDGAFPPGEVGAGRDESGTHFETDPQLKDPANGDFTPQGAPQVAARIGDPRWLPN